MAVNLLVANLRRLVQLWAIYAKLDLLWFLRDTKYCLAAILADVVSSLAAVASVFLLAERFGSIGGMSQDQILFMLGYAGLVDGVLMVWFNMNNVAWVSRIIGRGQLDHRLIQPVPLWMQLLTEGILPVSGNSMLLCGIGLTAYSVHQLALPISGIWLLLLGGSVLCSVAIILAYSYIFSSLAFYAPVAGEEVSTTAIGLFSTLKTFPIGGLSIAAKMVLCTVAPVGLAAWFPSNQLLGLPIRGLAQSLFLVVVVVLVIIAAMLFRKGLNHYAKYGSNRYSARGHRR